MAAITAWVPMGVVMEVLVAGLIVFFAIHFVPTFPAVRTRLLETLGAGPYKLVFSVLAAVGLGLIVYGYGLARPFASDLFVPPEWTRHLAFLLMLPALICLTAAYIPSRLRDRVRHPMLAAIKIWAFAHLLANGDSASALLFGGFLAYAVYDRISVGARGEPGLGERAKGRLGGDVAAVAVGVVAWIVMLLWGHAALIGVPLLAPVAIPS